MTKPTITINEVSVQNADGTGHRSLGWVVLVDGNPWTMPVSGRTLHRTEEQAREASISWRQTILDGHGVAVPARVEFWTHPQLDAEPGEAEDDYIERFAAFANANPGREIRGLE